MYRNEWDLPPPVGVAPVRGPRLWAWLVLGLVLSGAGLAAFVVPVPMFYAFLPGPVSDVSKLIQVEDAQTYSSEGKFLLTTVSIDTDVTLVQWVESMFDPDKAVIWKDELTGGASITQLEKQQREEMTASQQHAQEVALSTLGLGRPTSDGVVVRSTLPDYPAAEVLRAGDVIVSIDSQKVHSTCDVGRLIDRHEPGDIVRVGIRRKGVFRIFAIKAVSYGATPSAFLGLRMDNVNYRFEPEVDVTFETGEVAGPSGGLMMALTLYDLLTPEDLTQGRAIAGTGALECDGGVVPIGGIEQKVAGAEQQGAEIFFSPAANFEAAKTAADEIQVVAISRFDDALEYLEALD